MDPSYVGGHAVGLVTDREPVDVVGLGGSRAGTDVVETVIAQLCGLETVGEQPARHLVAEELHCAVRVVDDEPFFGAEQLVVDHQETNCVVAGATACVANHVGIALAQTRVLRWVEARVHIGEDRKQAGRLLGVCDRTLDDPIISGNPDQLS